MANLTSSFESQTSQLRHNFQASQAVHKADDIRTLNFQSQFNSMRACGPKLILLFTAAGWSSQSYTINFEFEFRGLHSTEVAFLLLSQRPGV